MKKCGIIGGVGPSATADLYKLIIKNTPAKKDQEHLRMIIDSHPQIPDRTKALLENGEDPVPYLLESINLLAKAGVDFVACPCNTAHVFLRKISSQISVHFIDMIDETIKFINKDNGKKTVGLLSTSGTAKTGIYQNTGEFYGVKILVPSDIGIKNEMEAIYGEQGIKAGTKYEKSQKNKDLLISVINELKLQGAEAIIMGCTEIPLCLDSEDTDLPLINPTEILAQAIVNYAFLY